ncbi:MAG: hypothetical protein Ct9H300mP1_08820 [Planctomycetaceae bacterium]|nr:MAG: hypothetical protein Ct9H300mP1_08820 [Planctomycetaceae bacterium]
MSSLRITGGTIYDPANGIDGDVGDIWIVDGRVVEAPAEPDASADRTLDANPGPVVMPGGIDMHCHIAGPKVNTARKMIPDEKRTAEPVPSHSADPIGQRWQRPQHIRHRVPLRRVGLHHRI